MSSDGFHFFLKVYLGPTDHALEYFASLGFHLPPRENPSDFFLDVVQAKVEPDASGSLFTGLGCPLPPSALPSSLVPPASAATSFHTRDLFPRSALTAAWRAHFSHKQEEDGPLGAPAKSAYGSLNSKGAGSRWASGDCVDSEEGGSALTWQERAALVKAEQPPLATTLRLQVARAAIEHMRFPSTFLYEVGLQLLVGFLVGALYSNFSFHDLQQMNFMVRNEWKTSDMCDDLSGACHSPLCLLCAHCPAMACQLSLGLAFTLSLTSGRVFGPGMPVFWREASPGGGMGLDKGAFFAAKCAVEVPRISLLVLALLSTFYPLACPRCPFHLHFAVMFASGWAVTGLAYAFTIAQDAKSAQASIMTNSPHSSLSITALRAASLRFQAIRRGYHGVHVHVLRRCTAAAPARGDGVLRVAGRLALSEPMAYREPVRGGDGAPLGSLAYAPLILRQPLPELCSPGTRGHGIRRAIHAS